MLRHFAIAMGISVATIAMVSTTINRLYVVNAQEPARAAALSTTAFPPASTGSGQATAGFPLGVGYGHVQPLRATATAPTKAMSEEEAKEAREFQECLAKLRNPGDESVDEIREHMSTLLSLQLDRDLAQREESLKEIEKRAGELRQQLEARRESKPETLKLLMTIVENPSAGFGLPDHWMRMLLPAEASRYTPYYTPESPLQAAPPTPVLPRTSAR